MRSSTIETDYLVIGAGALGMAFVDSLTEHSDADVVMVDHRHRPGGHWLDSYPFVQLHQPSRFYGVNSTSLGSDMVSTDGTEDAFDDRATGTEICSYYDQIMRDQFLVSGRVRFFPMCDYLGDRRFRSRVTGQVTDVAIRHRVVDATYMSSRVPATEPVPFEVAENVNCVPVGDLANLRTTPAGYVIVGGGKTALDAVCWLLDQGSDPDDITWIRPRDAWLLNRAFLQPSRSRTFAGFTMQLEAIVASESVEEAYERLEAEGLMLRIDRNVAPTMMRGATISVGELEQLRKVENVVRLGYVRRIDSKQITLEHGSIPTKPEHLHVNCTARGLTDSPPRTIFANDMIIPQLVTRVGLTLSGALEGFLETTSRTIEEKNALCPPTGMPHTPFDFFRAVLAGISTELSWSAAPDLGEWLERSRLNLLSGLPEDDALQELRDRFFTALFPALERMQEFEVRATPQEQGRIYHPLGHAGR
ncbi:MAG TPA: FAD/NAD(P)-binding protein [Acidimicrobiales bacterium]|nr:FAD/NAD(P)-binding protein [Acidimicrobiales bacterium]